jgi:hypothetical protein
MEAKTNLELRLLKLDLYGPNGSRVNKWLRSRKVKNDYNEGDEEAVMVIRNSLQSKIRKIATAKL